MCGKPMKFRLENIFARPFLCFGLGMVIALVMLVLASGTAAGKAPAAPGQAAGIQVLCTTTITGDITVNTIFNVAGSPYCVNPDSGIPGGVTLTINAGVTVYFPNTYSGFHINGILNAIGDSLHPIIFTSPNSSPAPNLWRGIKVAVGGRAHLEYVDLGYAGHDNSAGLRSEGLASLEVRHSHIHHNNGAGLSFFSGRGADYVITDSTFDYNTTWPVYESYGGNPWLNPTYTNLTFNANGGGDALYIVGGDQNGSRTFDGPASFNGKPIDFYNWALGIPNGVTITFQAGTVAQFMGVGAGINVGSGGILQVNGSAAQPVTLTTDQTAKSPGQWTGVLVQNGGKAVLNYCDIGYGGHDTGAGLRSELQTNLEVHHCRIHHNNGDGLYFFSGKGSNYIIADSVFEYNTAVPVYETFGGMPWLNPAYTNLTFNGNTGGDHVLIYGGSQNGNRIFNGPASFNGSPIFFNSGGIEIPDGVTITFEAGTVATFTEAGGGIRVYSGGTLLVNGSSGQLVTFTSDETSKGASQWMGVVVGNGGNAILNYCDIGYAGHDYGAGLRSELQTTLGVHHCRIHDNNGLGLYFFSGRGSGYTIDDSTFDHNSGAAIYETWTNNMLLNPTYSNLTFTANGLDALLIEGGGLFGARTLDGVVSFNGSPIHIQGNGLEINNSSTLTLNPGTTLKFTNNGAKLTVHSGGTLQVLGAGSSPAVLTSDKATRNPADWAGVIVENGGHASLNFCEISYAGAGLGYGLEVESSDVQVHQCRIHHTNGGIRVNNATTALTNVVVSDNSGAGLTSINSGSLVGLHTTIARNGTGIYANGGTSVANLTNTILAGNTTGAQADYSGVINLNSTLWDSNTTPVVGALTTDTRHINGPAAFAADGYHITLYSKALNAGVNVGVTIDIDGDPRPMPAGFAPDLGADEFKLYAIWLPVVRR